MKNQLKVLFGVVGLVVAGGVSAVTSWTLNETATGTTVDGVKVVATGWADTGTTVGSFNRIEAQTNSPTTHFVTYSGKGLGINNNDGCTAGAGCTASTTQDPGDTASLAPEHAIDNNGRYEMVLLDFGTKKVNLSSIGLGWNAAQDTWNGKSGTAWDSDFTVLAYDPSKVGALSFALGTKTWNALDSGWSVVANYSNGTNATTVNGVTTGNAISSSIYSSYWLVGAYNPLAGGVATDTINGVTSNRTTQDDYIKLKWVSGTVCATGATCGSTGQAPEPGSLALMGVGLLGLIRMRKAQKA